MSKELIPKNQYGIFVDKKDNIWAYSVEVAEYFEKEHKNVLRNIDKMFDSESETVVEFAQLNFEPCKYKGLNNKMLKCYKMTRDGFTFLTMGFTGTKAEEFKILYIKEFNKMEQTLLHLQNCRFEFPNMTKALKDYREMIGKDTKFYHYTNEVDLLYLIVLGCKSGHYKKANGIPKGESLRPYVTQEQAMEIEYLQRLNTGLIFANDYDKRKEILTKALEQYRTKRLGNENG